MRWSQPSSVTGMPEDPAALLRWLNLDDGNTTTAPDLMEMAAVAIDLIGKYQRRYLLSATFTVYLDDWPACGEIEIRDKLPITAISSVKYKEPDAGVLTTVTASNYHTSFTSYHSPARIRPISGYAWPTLQTGSMDRVQVTLTAGYGGYQYLPMTTRAAIRHIVANLDAFRESIIVGTINSELPNLKWAMDADCWGYCP